MPRDGRPVFDHLMHWVPELYTAGLRIGRDHVSSAVNTLAMAYAGLRCLCCCTRICLAQDSERSLDRSRSRRKSSAPWLAASVSSRVYP